MILAVLRFVPIWAWALAAALGWGAWQRHQATAAADRLAAERVQVEQARADAMLAALTETARRLQAQKGITDAARQRATAALVERDAAASAAGSLRERAEQLAAQCGAAGAASAPGGEAARAAGVVFADVLGRLEAHGRDAAAAADAAYSAGVACEAQHDTLTAR